MVRMIIELKAQARSIFGHASSVAGALCVSELLRLEDDYGTPTKGKPAIPRAIAKTR